MTDFGVWSHISSSISELNKIESDKELPYRAKQHWIGRMFDHRLVFVMWTYLIGATSEKNG